VNIQFINSTYFRKMALYLQGVL